MEILSMTDRAVLGAALTNESPLCLLCCAAIADTTPKGATALLNDLGKTVTIYEAGCQRCRACGTVGPAFLSPPRHGVN